MVHGIEKIPLKLIKKIHVFKVSLKQIEEMIGHSSKLNKYFFYLVKKNKLNKNGLDLLGQCKLLEKQMAALCTSPGYGYEWVIDSENLYTWEEANQWCADNRGTTLASIHTSTDISKLKIRMRVRPDSL